jgi:hypothetical protein
MRGKAHDGESYSSDFTHPEPREASEIVLKNVSLSGKTGLSIGSANLTLE